MMLQTFLHPVPKVSLILQKGGFRIQMSKSALLGTPYCNILNRDSITRGESSRIRHDMRAFYHIHTDAEFRVSLVQESRLLGVLGLGENVNLRHFCVSRQL